MAPGRRNGDAPQMAINDSALNPDETGRIRQLLAPRTKRERMWPLLGAALLAAISALAFATAMIMAPPVVSEHVVKSEP
ncbi:MAG: hypothetical protein JWQ97_3598 [Phenylobacterium sp.]|nr:hypothetical protein [Phenylobacterium sp.]